MDARPWAGWVLDQILVMLHPFMPFVTEELWHALAPRPRNYDLILAKWPEPEAEVDAAADAEIKWLMPSPKSAAQRMSRHRIPARG